MEKRRSVPVAVLLSVAMPGLGHLYCGRAFWALIFWPLSFAGWAVFLLGWGLGGMELKAAYPAFVSTSILVWISAAIHAGWCARKSGAGCTLKAYNIWYFYLLAWILGVSLPNWGLIRFVQGNLLTTFELSSDNMRPALLPGDRVMVDRRQSTLEDLDRGAVVAVADPHGGGTVRFLRLVGLGGETVELGPDGISINGKAAHKQLGEASYPRKTVQGEWIDQPVTRIEETLGDLTIEVFTHPDPAKRRTGKWELAPGRMLLLGDNRLEAGAVTFEPVGIETLIGRAFLIRGSKDPLTQTWIRERYRIPIR